MPATQKATNPIQTVICNTITPQLDQQSLMWDTVKGFLKSRNTTSTPLPWSIDVVQSSNVSSKLVKQDLW